MAQKHKKPSIPPIRESNIMRDFLVGVAAGVVVAAAAAFFVPQTQTHTPAECVMEETTD